MSRSVSRVKPCLSMYGVSLCLSSWLRPETGKHTIGREHGFEKGAGASPRVAASGSGAARTALKRTFPSPHFRYAGRKRAARRAGTATFYNIAYIIMQLLMFPEKAPTFQSENRDHTGSDPPEFCSLPPIDSRDNCKRERVRNPESTRLRCGSSSDAVDIFLWIFNHTKKMKKA